LFISLFFFPFLANVFSCPASSFWKDNGDG
jgi:hypothetical protein